MNRLKQLLGTLGFLSMALIAFVDLPPRPLPPPTPIAEIDSATIQLVVTDVLVPTATPWTQVQWLAGDGTWVTAGGWQGSLEMTEFSAESDQFKISGLQQWAVGDDLYGQADFRWQILSAENGAVVATSNNFNLPVRDGQVVYVKIADIR